MRDLSLLVWLTQLGLSVALPPAGFIMLALWLQAKFGWGQWILWVGIIFGIYCAVHGLITSLKALKRLSEHKSDDPAPVSYNEHD